jgi:hypothetical protein
LVRRFADALRDKLGRAASDQNFIAYNDMKETEKPKFVLCIDDDNGYYNFSLKLWKVYQTLPDAEAEETDMIRIIDESDEDYLYAADMFVPIELPQTVIDAILSDKNHISNQQLKQHRSNTP